MTIVEGAKYGTREVLRCLGPVSRSPIRRRYEVRCECGRVSVVEGQTLMLHGSCRSCSQLRRHHPRRYEIARYRTENPGYYLYELIRKRVEVQTGRVSFSLRPGDIEVPERCPMRGVPLERSRATGPRSPDSPTAVRLDPTVGWERGNVLVVSWAAGEALRTIPDIVEPLEAEVLGEETYSMTPERWMIEREHAESLLSADHFGPPSLYDAGIETVGDVLFYTVEDLIHHVRGFGRWQAHRLQAYLAQAYDIQWS